MSPIIHLALPPKNQVVLCEMCKWRTQCRSAGVGGSISNAWRERYRNPLCIRDTPPRKMWDIKPFYKAPSPVTGAKKPHKDQSRTRQIGKPYWNCTKGSSKTKNPQQQKQNWLLFAKKQDNNDLAFVFRRPEIFLRVKKCSNLRYFWAWFPRPHHVHVFSNPLDRCHLALSGLCYVRSVFSLFQDDFATKSLNWTISNLLFSGIREALQLVVPKNWKWRPARWDAEHPGILWIGFTGVSARQTKGRTWLEVLQCYLVRWCLKFRANLYEKKKAHHQNLILQGTLRLLTAPIFP